MDLWPCSSKDLDHLGRQEWLSRNINKTVEKPSLVNGAGSVDKSSLGLTTNSNTSVKAVYPDTSRMVVYDPRQKPGPTPDVDLVLSIILQSNLPTGQTGKMGTPSTQLQAGPASSMSDLSGSSRSHLTPSVSSFKPTRDRQTGKRKDLDRKDDDETATVQSQPLPKDVFKIRQLRKSRGTAVQAGSASHGSVQTGSASYGSGFSGELSGSTG